MFAIDCLVCSPLDCYFLSLYSGCSHVASLWYCPFNYSPRYIALVYFSRVGDNPSIILSIVVVRTSLHRGIVPYTIFLARLR